MKNKLKLNSSKYYIVDLLNITKPRLVKKEFDDKEQAISCIASFLENNFLRFDVVKGEEAITYELRFSYKRYGILNKYKYPPEKMTNQEKKTWRTMYRYHKRKNENRK